MESPGESLGHDIRGRQCLMHPSLCNAGDRPYCRCSATERYSVLLIRQGIPEFE